MIKSLESSLRTFSELILISNTDLKRRETEEDNGTPWPLRHILCQYNSRGKVVSPYSASCPWKL